MAQESKTTKDFLKEKASNLLFDLITDIPDSLHIPLSDPDEKVVRLTRQAALKTATISASLSIPAGVTGILTALPDIAAVWKIQAQLIADIAATHGKLALLSREAMVWCLFRHSAASLLRDLAVRTGSRIVVQQLSSTALRALVQKIGVKISTRFASKTLLRVIPVLGALGNGAYAYFDTNEVGKTAGAYFKALADTNAQAQGDEASSTTSASDASQTSSPHENAQAAQEQNK